MSIDQRSRGTWCGCRQSIRAAARKRCPHLTTSPTGDRVYLIKMSGLTPEQKEMLKNEIKKVRLDAKNQEALEKIPLERLVENYIEMSVEIIKEMEQRNDPVFVEVLQYAQAHLTQEVEKNKPHLTLAQTFSRHIFSEFLSIQIEIYAACNKIAMQQCTPVDKIAHLAIFQEPPV